MRVGPKLVRLWDTISDLTGVAARTALTLPPNNQTLCLVLGCVLRASDGDAFGAEAPDPEFAIAFDTGSRFGSAHLNMEKPMTQRPGAARGGLTIAQAQELILAQAEAARRAMPEVPRPNLAQSFIPVVGPAWEAAADFKDGDYPAAGFNAAVAITDAFGAGVAGKGLKAAGKGITALKTGSLTDNAARKAYRAAGMAGKGEEVSHLFGFRGIDRKAPNWRNHYMFLKPLPKEIHRRLTGSWGELERFDPVRRFWYGTNDWVKVAPPAIVGRAADVVDNLNRPRPTGSPVLQDQGQR